MDMPRMDASPKGLTMAKIWEKKADCKTCEHKETDFYYGLCPQTDADVLPQEGNRCFYYKRKAED